MQGKQGAGGKWKPIGFGSLVVSLKKIKFYNKAVSQFL